MEVLGLMKWAVSIVFMICVCYQTVFLVSKLYIKVTGRKKSFSASKLCRYAVVISARNERSVIGQLIESIKTQDYPAELVDIYVVADNCTDDTAHVARKSGATVYERFNTELIGKGYALTYLFNIIKTEHSDVKYDGYFVFDADNLLDEKYISEMNKVFTQGYDAVTSYRNTKNYGDNWISACYGMWFLKEAEFQNHPRLTFESNSFLSGTGFLFSNEILEENGGWKYHLLTEDLEFTADLIIRGKRIGYCHDAVFYDEQPTGFRQSITQRTRWIKGSTQVFFNYGKKLLSSIFKEGNFSSYDMIMNSIPLFAITVISMIIEVAGAVLTLVSPDYEFSHVVASILKTIASSYVVIYAAGLLTVITEWKRIKCSASKKILYCFMFPVFTYSFIFAGIKSVFGTVRWEPIKHTATMSINDVNSAVITKTRNK